MIRVDQSLCGNKSTVNMIVSIKKSPELLPAKFLAWAIANMNMFPLPWNAELR